MVDIRLSNVFSIDSKFDCGYNNNTLQYFKCPKLNTNCEGTEECQS